MTRVVERNQNFRDEVARLAGFFLQAAHDFVDFVLPDRDEGSKSLLHGLVPGHVHPDLLFKGRLRNTASLQRLRDLLGRHVRSLRNALERVFDFLLRDRNIEPFRFLRLEILVDQRAKHLPANARNIFRRVRNSRAQQHQLHALVEIVGGNHQIVDDRGNALRVGCGGRRGCLRKCDGGHHGE